MSAKLQLCWWWVAGLAVLTAAACAGSGFSLAFDSGLVAISGLGALGLLGALAAGRLAKRLRLAVALHCFALLVAVSIVYAFLQYPAAHLGRPLIDPQLATIDHWLRFDWPTWFAWVRSRPALFGALRMVYLSLAWQSMLMCLVALRDPERLEVCMVANVLGLTCCLAVSALWPAGSAFVYFHAGAGVVDYNPAQFLAVHGGNAPMVLALGRMQGIVTFPSYHAASAVILGYAFWALPRCIALSAAALEALVCASALPVGGHYLIDVIAGIALGAVTLAAARSSRFQFGLHAAHKTAGAPRPAAPEEA